MLLPSADIAQVSEVRQNDHVLSGVFVKHIEERIEVELNFSMEKLRGLAQTESAHYRLSIHMIQAFLRLMSCLT